MQTIEGQGKRRKDIFFSSDSLENRMTHLEALIKHLADSNQELLTYLKQIQKTNTSENRTDNTDNTDTDNIEVGVGKGRVYTTQDIVNMLTEKSNEQRGLALGQHGQQTSCMHNDQHISQAIGTSSIKNLINGKSPVGSAIDSMESMETSEDCFSPDKKRKVIVGSISKYFPPVAKVSHRVQHRTLDTDGPNVDAPLKAPTASSKQVTAYIRGGPNTTKYLTSHPYIRSKAEMQSKGVVSRKRPPTHEQQWWVCLRLKTTQTHTQTGKVEFKGWCITLAQAEATRDKFLSRHGCKIAVNRCGIWETVPIPIMT